MEMTVPSAIQKQVEDAERLQSELYGSKEALAEPVENTPEPEVVAPEVAPEPVAEPKVEPVQEQKPAEDFERQYKVLRGKYDAEVPRMQQQLREQARQMQELQARLEQAAKQAEQPAKEEAHVTDKDSEEFGSDLVDMVRRASRAEATNLFKAQMAEVEKRFAALLQQVGVVQERVQMSEEDKFWARVQSQVSDWDAVDQDESWIAFLNTRAPGSVKTRRDLAAEAISSGNADAISELVEAWRGPKQVVPDLPPAVNQDLQRQVQPSSVKSSAPVAPAGKILSKSDYEALYDPRNVQRFGQKKADEMIRDADLAVAEGRVRW